MAYWSKVQLLAVSAVITRSPTDQFINAVNLDANTSQTRCDKRGPRSERTKGINPAYLYCQPDNKDLGVLMVILHHPLFIGSVDLSCLLVQACVDTMRRHCHHSDILQNSQIPELQRCPAQSHNFSSVCRRQD